MKKTIVTILIFAMIIVFTGCGGTKPEQPVSSGSGKIEPAPTQTQKQTETQYVPNGNEKSVSITDFMNLMMCDKGKWECPAQYNDYGLEFSSIYGRYLVNMSNKNFEEETSVNLIAEIGSVSYNEEQKIYCVNLLDYDMPLAYKELHVDVSAIGGGLIHAENIYDNYQSAEFIFSAEDGDLINGLILTSGTTAILEHSSENGIIGVESQTWVLKDGDLLEAYKPLISLDSAGYFSIKENLYDGMGHIFGTYVETEKEITCTVYTIDFSGYAGDNVYSITFEKTSPTTLTLKTNLCYSMSGAVFELQ